MARIRACPASAIFCCSRPSPMTPIPAQLPASNSWCREHQGFRHAAPGRVLDRKTGPSKFPSITTEGDTPDQVLNAKIGDLQLAIIVVGKAQN